jgi:hypothetical protein
LVHLLVNQIPTGDSTDVGREHIHLIHLRAYVLLMYYGEEEPLIVGLASREPFLLLSRAKLGSFTKVSQIPTGGSTYRCRNGVHECHTLLSYVLYILVIRRTTSTASCFDSFFYCLDQGCGTQVCTVP